jgi:DNA-binding CsgD family transcriptional regulator
VRRDRHAGLAERARRELLAVGQTIGTRTVGTRDQLTPQEDQIARLARAGLSNAEIAAQLFLSAHTDEWHLRKVFTKLRIGSRLQLQRALPDGPAPGRRPNRRVRRSLPVLSPAAGPGDIWPPGSAGLTWGAISR